MVVSGAVATPTLETGIVASGWPERSGWGQT